MEKDQLHVAPDGFNPVAAQCFTGTAWLKMLVTSDAQTNCGIGEVIFEPGARNHWHTHHGWFRRTTQICAKC